MTGKNISDKEYKHAIKFWKKFQMKTMKDYHELYLQCDVLLLADVSEKFRNNSLWNYGLCPSWESMLKITKIKLELIPDPDMFIFFEKGARSGISNISNRYSITNNKYLKFYDPKQESKHIGYLDANNIYG